MITEFFDTDDTSAHNRFQDWRTTHQKGVFLTVTTKTRANLHGTRCQHLGSGPPYFSLDDGFGSLTSKRKICGTESELLAWATESGVTVKRCFQCMQSGRIASDGIDIADIQNRDARKLLRLIASAVKSGKNLSYWDAAKQMGRVHPQNHSRAVAQMCDLLDAAACLAGVPLLALVTVRERSGEINPKAWTKEYGPRRDAIIQRSLRHQFLPDDFTAISRALDDLGEKGNVNAWRYVQRLFPGDLLYRRLVGASADTGSNAVDDLGADTPDRAKSETWSYVRDSGVREAVLRRANGMCEFCGRLGFMKPDGIRYLECHHIIALANDGADRETNVIALCPHDHREAHFGVRAEELERKMVLRLRPQI
jgi:hypothetical protein